MECFNNITHYSIIWNEQPVWKTYKYLKKKLGLLQIKPMTVHLQHIADLENIIQATQYIQHPLLSPSTNATY